MDEGDEWRDGFEESDDDVGGEAGFRDHRRDFAGQPIIHDFASSVLTAWHIIWAVTAFMLQEALEETVEIYEPEVTIERVVIHWSVTVTLYALFLVLDRKGISLALEFERRHNMHPVLSLPHTRLAPQMIVTSWDFLRATGAFMLEEAARATIDVYHPENDHSRVNAHWISSSGLYVGYTLMGRVNWGLHQRYQARRAAAAAATQRKLYGDNPGNSVGSAAILDVGNVDQIMEGAELPPHDAVQLKKEAALHVQKRQGTENMVNDTNAGMTISELTGELEPPRYNWFEAQLVQLRKIMSLFTVLSFIRSARDTVILYYPSPSHTRAGVFWGLAAGLLVLFNVGNYLIPRCFKQCRGKSGSVSDLSESSGDGTTIQAGAMGAGAGLGGTAGHLVRKSLTDAAQRREQLEQMRQNDRRLFTVINRALNRRHAERFRPSTMRHRADPSDE